MSYDYKGLVKAKRELYYTSESNWGIYECQIIQTKETSEKFSIHEDNVVIKGNMPQLVKGNKYYLTAKEVKDRKFGNQLEIICIANAIDQYPRDPMSKRKVLQELFTSKQVDAMYSACEDPFDLFMNGNTEKLTTIKGCGIKTAAMWAERFNDFIPLNKVYLELEQYELTNTMIKKLLLAYKSADLVIEKVKNNPYCLCEIGGIGWKTADSIAMKGGIKEHSIERVKSFILSYLAEQGSQGYSFVEPAELMAAIVENLGESFPDFTITEAIHSLEKVLFWNKDKTLIGLRRFWDLENKIADEVLRLLNASSDFQYGELEKTIIHNEERQGWSYTDEQISGVKLALENNFVVVMGGAGSGKTSLVGLLLALLGDKYRVAQTALSGRAASRLAEVTHKEGYTIHRLLGYPKGPDEKGKFLYNDDQKLDYDVIIIDEMSMIGGYLFYDLIRSIKSGSKVILLGDTGQLEAIGECNVAHDLLACPSVPRQILTKCHRQALKSAIITQSMKVRAGEQIISRGWVGSTTLGELQDLTLDCYSDASNTYHKVIRHFTECLKKQISIMNLQVLSPVKEKGSASVYQLNLALQEIYNPSGKDEIVVKNVSGMIYGIRVGDKVINTRNSYGVSVAYTDKETDVYNGNIGIVKSINTKNRQMIIDFQDVGIVEMQNAEVNNVELAYAVSVHKYQGSECSNVIVALDFSAYTLLTRELVYTALTRAKSHCILVAQNKALIYAVSNPSTICKRTYLTEILNDRLHPQNKFDF